ncbi:aldolase [Olivibacter sp. SDN3]|uniref:HpcH/HpaI aldolase family protein n=1 Tax=Olivibacter sp. SDN3 TaxID=2764720 RepID=UPI0016511729|nr:aldolase/citrate lyase family protein [Olivibacter sp. SDN3]QNL51558.1 aldolase [Olivibacter sp. SDN3]
MMRKSTVLEKLRSNQKASCFKVNLKDAQVAEIAAIQGFDCIWVDLEHIGQDWSVIAAHVWATKAHRADLMVRVPRGAYSDYIRPLELDATGILVPHVMSLQDAKDIIYQTRFFPLGRRPLDGGNADAAYTHIGLDEYLSSANRERFIALQIEDPEPLPELEAIAQLEGFDMLFFGPGDFSQGIGAPGQWDHPLLVDARKRVAAVANQYGKFAATVGSPETLESLFAMGYHLVSVGADVVGLSQYCQRMAAAFVGLDSSDTTGTYYERP